MAILDFNATDVAPTSPLEALPAGTYECCIVESGMFPTKSGNGSFLKLTFEVVSGEHAGRKLFARLNLDNPNPTAVQIARGDLSAICRAVGVMSPHDSEELHNLPLLVTVRVRRLEDGDVNDIRGYAPVKRSAPAPSAPTSVPPWQR